MKQSRNSFATNLRRGIFVSPNHPTHHRFSSSRKRMANYVPYKTIGRSTHSQSEINILSPLSQTSFAISAMRTYIQNSMSAGGITTSASEKAMRRKQRSKPDTAFLNPPSCTLVSQTHQPPSKL